MGRNLTEALGTKPEKLVLDSEEQENVFESARAFKLEVIGVEGNDVLLCDYINPQIKKRAQTIGTAFSIASKSLVCMVHDIRKHVKNNYFEKDLFSFNNEKWPAVRAELELLGQEYVNRFEEALKFFNERREQFDSGNIESLPIFSFINNSITVAWLLAKYKSGFFPADVSVMLMDSEDHSTMYDELDSLLAVFYENTLSKIVLALSYSNEKTKYDIYSEPSIEDESGFECSVDFIFGDILLDVTTSSSLPKSINETNLKAFMYLNNKNKKYEAVTPAIKLIRFNKSYILGVAKDGE